MENLGGRTLTEFEKLLIGLVKDLMLEYEMSGRMVAHGVPAVRCVSADVVEELEAWDLNINSPGDGMIAVTVTHRGRR